MFKSGQKKMFLSCRKWKEQIVLPYTDRNTIPQSCPLVLISKALMSFQVKCGVWLYVYFTAKFCSQSDR